MSSFFIKLGDKKYSGYPFCVNMRRSHSQQEKNYGADHLETLRTVNKLGLLESELGNHKEAKALYLRALAGEEKNYGADHPLKLQTFHGYT